MPIRPSRRFFHPVDWPQLSRLVRFGRAGGPCERRGRQHGAMVCHLEHDRADNLARRRENARRRGVGAAQALPLA
jgi:hypothetical protein